jgi:hypothetical protein
MWTRTKISGTEKYPTPKDLLAALLVQLIENNSGWAHFEIVAKGGWFWNYFSGRKPWIEVSPRAGGFMELNLGLPKSKKLPTPLIPDKWTPKSKNLRIVPLSDQDELIAWIDHSFATLYGNPAYRLMGWLDGF